MADVTFDDLIPAKQAAVTFDDLIPKPSPAARLNPPVDNPRPFAGRMADAATRLLSTTEPYAQQFAEVARNPVKGAFMALNPRANPDLPLVDVQLPPKEQTTPIGEGIGKFVKNVIEGGTSVEGAGQMAMLPKMIADMAAQSPEHAARFGEAIANKDTAGATEALLNYAMTVAPVAHLIKSAAPILPKAAAEAAKSAPTDFTKPVEFEKKGETPTEESTRTIKLPPGAKPGTQWFSPFGDEAKTAEKLTQLTGVSPEQAGQASPIARLQEDRIAEVSPDSIRDMAKQTGRDLGSKTPMGMWAVVNGKEFLFINEDLSETEKAEVRAHELKHRDIQHAIENNDSRFDAVKQIVQHVMDNPEADPNLHNLVQALGKGYGDATHIAKELLADGHLDLDRAKADLFDLKAGKHANQEGLIVRSMIEKRAKARGAEAKPPVATVPTENKTEVAAPAENAELQKPKVEIPLGLNRPVKENFNYHALSDEDFDKEYSSAKKDVYDLEGQWDKDEQSVDRNKLAAAQDRWSAVDLERFRRNERDTIPADLMHRLRQLSDSAATHGPGSEAFEKARIIIEELRRQGASPQDILKEINLKSPDAAEVFKAQLQDIQKVASQIPPEPAKQLPPSKPAAVEGKAAELQRIAQGTKRIGDTFVTPQPESKAASPVDSYVEKTGLPAMQKGKLKSTLSQQAIKRTAKKTYSGDRAKVVSEMLLDGYEPKTEEVNAIKDLTGTQYNRMDNRQQAEFEKRQKEAGKKIEYRLEEGAEGSFFVVTKAEYDYAKWLQSNEESKPTEPPAAVESKMQAAVDKAPVKPNSAAPTQAEAKKTLVSEIQAAIEKAPSTSDLTDEQKQHVQSANEIMAKKPPSSLRDQRSKEYWNRRQGDYAKEYMAKAKAAGLPQVTIEIPGDGTFTVWNTKEHLGELLKRAQRLETSKTEAPTVKRQGIGKEVKAEVAKILANPEKEKPIVSMGGLAPGDPGEEVGKGGKGGTVGYGGDIYGIAERVRQARAGAGKVADIPPGEGVGAEESVEHGRDLLKGGTDPEAAMQAFEKSKAISADAIALARAQGEALAQAARNIEIKFGTNSPEYKLAFDALSAWDRRSKAMQTEWHKIGMAQQGETDIDTGSFTGLQRAFKDATGKDFTPGQADKAKKIASENSKADAEEQKAKEKLYKTVDAPLDPKIKGIVDRILDFSHKQADAARARIKARAYTFSAGLDRTVLADVAIIGADHILTGAKTPGDWSAKMVDEFGEGIRKHLDEIYKASEQRADEITKKIAGPEEARVKTSRKPAPETLPEIKQIMASHQKGTEFTAEQVQALWSHVKTYLNKGVDNYGSVRNKVATDLGLPIEEVNRGLTQNPTVKRMADDVWQKQYNARQLKQRAKQWLADQQVPGLQRIARQIPRAFFGAKVFGHGAVALGTHAPMVAFQPKYWASYINDYGKMVKMNLSPAFYEMQMSDLVRRPNFTVARRAGLVNDPASVEDFNNSGMTGIFDTISKAGNRGYSILKLLRQDMFDQQWDALPETAQTPEVAQKMADAINHVTGVTKASPPRALNVGLFAPRLEASRIAWLTVDPAKAGAAFANWKNATDAEKMFAVNQVKEKATVFATMAGLLAANQAILSASGSKQKINLTDPMKSDWMKFKGMGMDFSYGNPYITLLRLPVRLGAIREKSGTGKLKNLIYPDESMSSEVAKYVRSQLSPFASFASDIAFKGDYANRPLPKMPLSGEQLPVPKRLKAQGVTPYTWSEFLSETALPIPAEEAAREVWKNGFGMSDAQQKAYLKALATITVMSGTGGRLTDDWELNSKK